MTCSRIRAFSCSRCWCSTFLACSACGVAAISILRGLWGMSGRRWQLDALQMLAAILPETEGGSVKIHGYENRRCPRMPWIMTRAPVEEAVDGGVAQCLPLTALITQFRLSGTSHG